MTEAMFTNEKNSTEAILILRIKGVYDEYKQQKSEKKMTEASASGLPLSFLTLKCCSAIFFYCGFNPVQGSDLIETTEKRRAKNAENCSSVLSFLFNLHGCRGLASLSLRTHT